jgi:two-component system chemotaxis response regulator CheY
MNILIVEDEPALQDMIHLYLTDYGTCDIAANGIEALAAVEQAITDGRPYDLVCMDIMMPQMDGLEALKKIRRMEIKRYKKGQSGVKVIMITAKDTAKDMISAYNAGSEAYITKPFTRERLLEQIRQLGLPVGDSNEPTPEDSIKP